MEVLLHRKHQCFILWYAFDFVAPFACHLHSGFYSLCTSIHGQHHVEAEHLRNKLGEAGENIVVESATAERQSRSLLSQGLDEFWVTMTLVHGAVCGEEVEIVLAFWVPD